jgi:hypothetical protein
MADKSAFEQNQILLNPKPRVKLNSWISHRVNRRLSQLNVANAITFRCLCPVQLKYVSYLLWIVLTVSILNRWHERF